MADALLQNPDLLRQLAAEFKRLKTSSQADAVDYNAWMRQRLRELRVVPNTAQGVQNAKASALQDALGKENEAPQALQSQLKSLAPEPMPAPKQAVQPLGAHNARARPTQRPTPSPAMGLVETQLQAAAERERRLALSSALARQHVALGIVPPHLRESVDTQQGTGGASGSQAAADTSSVLDAARRITEQHQSVLEMVRATQQQLEQHKALLQEVASTVANASQAQPQQAHTQPANTAPTHAAGIAAAAAAAPAAWFLDPASPAGQPSQGPTLASVQPTEPLHVLATCSPTGRFQRTRQQRKQELKAALRRVLFTDALPVLSSSAPQQGDTSLGGRARVTRGTGQGVSETARDEERVRAVLTQLLGRDARGVRHGSRAAEAGAPTDAATGGQRRHQAEVVAAQAGRGYRDEDRGREGQGVHGVETRHKAAHSHHQGHTTARPSAGHNTGVMQPPSHFPYANPADVTAVEEEAAAVIERDRVRAEQQIRHARLNELEAQLTRAIHTVQQQAGRLAQLSSPNRTQPPTTAHATQPPAPTHPDTALHTDPSAMYPTALRPRDNNPGDNVTQMAPSVKDAQAGGDEGGAGDGMVDSSNPQLALHRLLTELQRIEESEAAIRKRWMGAQAPDTAAPVSAASGVVTQQAAMVTQQAQVASQPAQSASQPLPQGQSAGHGSKSSRHPSSHTPPTESLTVDAVEAIQEHRRVFHEHQRMVDGLLLSDAISNDIQPQEVVEDIADAILSDLLGEEAEKMLAACDEMAEQVFDSEFL